MNKLLILILTTIISTFVAYGQTTPEYTKLFKNYNACFILYDINKHKIVSQYNPDNRCNERISPDSTFKVALSLMAFNEGIINQKTVFAWDGIKRDLPEWNQDQTPRSWLKYSAVWVSQKLSPQLGLSRIKHYLLKFNYGNQDFSGDPGKNNGLTNAWLSSSLKISANEQLELLKAMHAYKLPLTKDAIDNTKDNIYQGKLNNGADYYAKTGSGHSSKSKQLREGWFEGFIQNGTEQYIFVSNLTDKSVTETNSKAYGGLLIKLITLKILNDYFFIAHHL